MNIPGLVDGESYTLYIKCEDDSENLNTKDFVLQFSVEQFDERGGPLPIAIIFGAIIVIIVLILLVVLVVKRRKGNIG